MSTEIENYDNNHQVITLVGQGISFSPEHGGDGVELEIECRPNRTYLHPDGTSETYISINAEDWAMIVEYVSKERS